MIPWPRLTTLFLDAGNTLVSVDFERVAQAVCEAGVACDADVLRRAEAAARPVVSARVGRGVSTEATDAFAWGLARILERLPALEGAADADVARHAAALARRLRTPGRADLLWCAPLPRVAEALARLRELGLGLVVVSNSDGTADRSLAAAGLLDLVDCVVDSAVVGYEKPDPRIFHAALRRCGASPDGTLHVGDLFHADVLGAREAGLHAALLDPYGDWDGVDCAVFPDLSTLAEALESGRLGG